MNKSLEARSGRRLAGRIDQTICPDNDLTEFEIAENASGHIASLAAAMRPDLMRAEEWEFRHSGDAYCIARFWGVEYCVGVDIDEDGKKNVEVNFIRIDSKGYRTDYKKPCTTTAEVAMAAVTLLGLVYTDGNLR